MIKTTIFQTYTLSFTSSFHVNQLARLNTKSLFRLSLQLFWLSLILNLSSKSQRSIWVQLNQRSIKDSFYIYAAHQGPITIRFFEVLKITSQFLFLSKPLLRKEEQLVATASNSPKYICCESMERDDLGFLSNMSKPNHQRSLVFITRAYKR